MNIYGLDFNPCPLCNTSSNVRFCFNVVSVDVRCDRCHLRLWEYAFDDVPREVRLLRLSKRWNSLSSSNV